MASLPQPSQQIDLEGQTISYTIRRSLRAKYVRLVIQPASGLLVVIPRRFRADQIPGLIRRKMRWVLRTLPECQRRNPATARNDSIFYLGRELKVIARRGISQPEAPSLERDTLTVSVGQEDTLEHALERWYRPQAERLLGKKVEVQSARLGIRYSGVTVRRARTRWGSCSKKGSLNFNWKLVMAPEPVIDYVIIHELCHLRQMDHSAKFWKLVEAACPDYREHRAWLKSHEAELAARP